MAEFTIFFRGRRSFESPERAQQNAQKWQGWFKELGTTGHIREPSHRTALESVGKVVRGSEKTVSDTTPSADDLVSGYARIEAQDLAEAVRLSEGCPILEVGGSVEVRPIQQPKG